MNSIRTIASRAYVVAPLALLSFAIHSTASVDKAKGAPAAALLSLEVKPTAVAFSPDGRQLAAAAEDQTIRVWSLPDGKPRQTLSGHRLAPGALALSRDGKLLASMACSPSRPGSAEFKLWNLADGKLVHEVVEEVHRSDGDGADPQPFVAFSPDSALVVYPGKDRTVVVWDIRGRKAHRIEKLGLVPSAAAFSPDGNTLALGTSTGDSHGTVSLWSVEKDFTKRPGDGHAIYSGVMTLAWSADGNDLFVGHRHRHMAVYQLQFADSRRKTAPDYPLWNWKGDRLIDALAFTGNGRLIALDNEGAVEIWNTATKERIIALPDTVGPLAVSHDGSFLAAIRGGALQIFGVP